jgi:hypothetical protein
MNPKWFGDSYDIVKRFFVDNLRIMEYEVFIDPMLTSEWNGKEKKFYKLIDALPFQEYKPPRNKAALLVDPDTGIGKTSPKHISIPKLIEH